MEPLRLYVIGPVTGIPGNNLAEFVEAKDRLQTAGYDVTIPHDIISSNADWLDAVIKSINQIGRYDGVAQIDGWALSDGAMIEYTVADRLGIPVKPVDEWLRDAE